MWNLLFRHFIKDPDDVKSPAVRTRYGLFASILCIACNTVLCLAKGAVGLACGSLSIVADALNNLTDAFSNVVALLGFKLAGKPADAKHPFGHGRYEYLAGLAVAVTVVVVGANLAQTSIGRILSPEPVAFSAASAVVLGVSMAVKWWMMRLNDAAGEKIGSQTLHAAAVDSRNDIVATAGVLACSLLTSFSNLNLDGWAGLAIGAFIVVGGARLVFDTVSPLLGQAPEPKQVERIRRKILSYPGVLGTHDLMVHDYGPGRQFASAHVEMAAETDPLESHRVLNAIEQDFWDSEGLAMTLHLDPMATDDESAGVS